jgi:adenosylmethionine-8-amino-7-oxononanoate aminotransferase
MTTSFWRRDTGWHREALSGCNPPRAGPVGPGRLTGMSTATEPTATSRYSFVPGGAPLPLIVSGDGAYLYQADGSSILDAGGGAILVNIGHGRIEVADAVYEAMTKLDYVMPLWATPNRLLLHDTLVQRWLPQGFDSIFFSSGGSESADSSLRLARAYHLSKGRPERWKIIGRHPSYHGITLGAIAAASHSGRRAGYEPLLLDFPKVSWNDPADVERVILAEGPETIAGFLFEPITGASGGCLVASDDYWRRVNEICKRHDILLIADEVMTGFGRTGTTWGFQHFPVEPDVIYGGKGLGGGYVPMGMVATTERVTAALNSVGGFMFFTFTGGDAMCAGANKVLEILEREQLTTRVAEVGAQLERRLRMELGDHTNVIEIRGKGLMLGIELGRDRHTGERFDAGTRFAARVVGEALARGVWVYPAGSGPVQDAVMIGAPFIIDDADIEKIVTVLHESIDAAVAGL